MKLIIYCQHVLGMGHFFRILEIAKAFKGHEIVLITGGQSVPITVPDFIRQICLPPLMMDENFSTLYSLNSESTVDDVKELRKQQLMEVVTHEKPDIFLVELYPFGRKAFGFELNPVLDVLSKDKNCLVMCSLRDILVEKENTHAYEARVIKLLNRYFDGLLIHADQNVIALDSSFSQMDAIQIPIHYTGFVTPHPNLENVERIRQQFGVLPGTNQSLMVVSAGSGSVGGEILEAVVRAKQRIQEKIETQLKTILITGPYMPEKQRKALAAQADSTLLVFEFYENFIDLLGAADLSLCMGGYNTVMNCLAANTPTLALPFDQNREQGFRITTLSKNHAIHTLNKEDLEPELLAAVIQKHLIINKDHQPQTNTQLNLDGAALSYKILMDAKP